MPHGQEAHVDLMTGKLVDILAKLRPLIETSLNAVELSMDIHEDLLKHNNGSEGMKQYLSRHRVRYTTVLDGLEKDLRALWEEFTSGIELAHESLTKMKCDVISASKGWGNSAEVTTYVSMLRAEIAKLPGIEKQFVDKTNGYFERYLEKVAGLRIKLDKAFA